MKGKDPIKKYIPIFVLFLFIVSLSYLSGSIIKNIVKVKRPCISLPGCPNDYSFPSMSSLILFSLTTVFFYEKRKLNLHFVLLPISIIISSYEIIILTSRPLDVLFGLVFGFSIGYMTHKIFRFLGKE
ncbi:MAG: phosphatase PAP2 family protein [Candidatus Aenigmarchaeota archaeon]|nr:phosphatase PAP2 family protein [Candidatus Aenigmarchaeota archaeon]